MSRTIKVSERIVQLPKGYSDLTGKHKDALSQLFSEKGTRLRRDKACRIVFFHNRAGNPVAVQRCADRKLKLHNRKQCRVKEKGPNYGKFKPCPETGVRAKKAKKTKRVLYFAGPRRRRHR